MARVTVEDCAEVVPSRFELVALAAQRAKIIGSGGKVTLERDGDKDAVVALREIANGNLDVEKLRELVIQNQQEKVQMDEFGVESTEEEEKTTISVSSEEVVDDIASLQEEAPKDDQEALLYGDNIDVDD